MKTTNHPLAILEGPGDAEQARRTRMNLCSRCGTGVERHAKTGKCPDGDGEYTWCHTRESARELMEKLQGGLDFYDDLNRWRKEVGPPLPPGSAARWAEHHTDTTHPDDTADHVWGPGAYHSRREVQLWADALSDLGMALHYVLGPILRIHQKHGCNDYEDPQCGDACTCPVYPCPCGFNPFEYSAHDFRHADHYASVTLERFARFVVVPNAAGAPS